MEKKTAILATEDNLLADLTFHNVPASLLSEFAEKIVKPYYSGNMNAAIQDLLHKTLAEQDFILSHITHARTREATVNQMENRLMGKTVESYRIALESEIHRWNGLAKALRKEDRETFELMDMCRRYASESSCATNPIVFEPMLMSIVLFLQRKTRELEKN